MGASRVKTIAIVVLLLINIFFGTVILIDKADDSYGERQAIEHACAVMRSGGISIEPDAVITNNTIRRMRATRVDESEARIAQAVLGQTVMTDLGVIYRYENEQRGTAEFYSAGDFEIRFNEGVIPNENGTLRTVQEFLRDMGLETASQTVSISQEREIVTVVEAYKGASIFNCTIEFMFVEGYLQTIIGRYVTGVEPVEDSAKMMQAGTALLGFLAWVRNGNAVCTQIDKVEAGYQHRILGSFGEDVIVPAWLITTDTVRYIIDDGTGEIWTAS